MDAFPNREGIFLVFIFRHQTLITFANLKQVKMGMDKNTVIGFVLIGALLIAMLMFNSKSRCIV